MAAALLIDANATGVKDARVEPSDSPYHRIGSRFG